MTKFITKITKPYFCLILHIFCESGTHSFIWVLNTMPKFREKKTNHPVPRKCPDKRTKRQMERIWESNKTSGKTVFIVGILNIKSSNYDCNNAARKLFRLVFQGGFLPFIRTATGVTKNITNAIDHMITDAIFENKMQSGIIKTDLKRSK